MLFQACQSGKGKDIPNVSDIPVTVEFRRFDQDLFSLDTNNFAAGLAQLEAKCPEFSQVFFGQVLGSKDSTLAPEGHERYVRGFVTHPAVRKLYDTCQVVFPNLKGIEEDFRQALRFYKYYFPTQAAPQEIVTFVSEYTLGGFLYGENSIGVGLDFYLGEEYPYQAYNPNNPNFSAYLTRSFNREHLVMKSLQPLVEDLLGNPGGSRMLDYMIHNGKKLYLLDLLLPNAPDSVRLEYAQPQVEWCEQNETNIWALFIQDNLLYETDFSKFRKLVEYSPSSPGMPKEAPGRTANWLGWQIIKAYMKRHPDTSPEALIALKDAQALLEQSKYKPPR